MTVKIKSETFICKSAFLFGTFMKAYDCVVLNNLQDLQNDIGQIKLECVWACIHYCYIVGLSLLN